jgi:hypothetical protein
MINLSRLKTWLKTSYQLMCKAALRQIDKYSLLSPDLCYRIQPCLCIPRLCAARSADRPPNSTATRCGSSSGSRQSSPASLARQFQAVRRRASPSPTVPSYTGSSSDTHHAPASAHSRPRPTGGRLTKGNLKYDKKPSPCCFQWFTSR